MSKHIVLFKTNTYDDATYAGVHEYTGTLSGYGIYGFPNPEDVLERLRKKHPFAENLELVGVSFYIDGQGEDSGMTLKEVETIPGTPEQIIPATPDTVRYK